MRLSLRNKLVAVVFSTLVFSGLGILAVMVVRGDLVRAAPVIFGLGLTLSLFEEFYVQGRPGRWLRAMHPAVSMLIYGLVITVFAITVVVTVRTYMGHMMDAPGTGRMRDAGSMSAMGVGAPPIVVVFPALFAISIVTIMTLRIVGYLGVRNLVHLMIGTYYRPVLENRIFLFLDIKGSTALVERLGPIETRALIGKFFFDISGPITDLGGEIYRFTGDGVVAVWSWDRGIVRNRIVRTIDAIANAVDREAGYYRSKFGHVPEYRIGVHGGPIVTSEEGDNRRAIGFYGDTIHIAARLEQMAKDLGISGCLLSASIAEHQTGYGDRLRPVGEEPIRGISDPITVYELGHDE